MKKMLVIELCWDCPYNARRHFFQRCDLAEKMFTTNEYKKISGATDPDYFPLWCPLPDAKDQP
jgi:hypothetical protein